MNKNNAIKHCRSCLSKKLINVLSLGEQYLSDFLASNKKPKKYPLDLVLCKNCYLLQLRHTAPKEELYTERYGYRSGINKTMRKELKEIVEMSLEKIKDYEVSDLVVLDIGANDGTLLSNYKKNVFRIGIEPVKKFANECKKYADVVINDFFNYGSYFKKVKKIKAHIVTAISCFYDIDDPNKFVSDVKKILRKDGIFVIQQNYLLGMLRYNAFDNVVHEHLEYYSLLSLENLLLRHGLEVFDVEQSYTNGGSFRTFIIHKDKRKISKSVVKMRVNERKLNFRNKKIYTDFAKRVRDNKKELYRFISKLKNDNKKIFVYGASTRGNTLLQYYNLNNRLIEAAVERNPEKWGKKIASVGIPIISEVQGRLEKPDYMLVLPWFFAQGANSEFVQREKEYLMNGGTFIIPLPELHLISKNDIIHP